jgi:hypothetical protein
MTRRTSLAFVMCLSVLVAAPTVGDIGSCGAPVAPLDATKFFDARLRDTCQRCRDCGLSTLACNIACDPGTPRPDAFPTGCTPDTHDGEVCLDSILALSCHDVGRLVSDTPVAPTECDFCPASAAEAGP